MNGLFDRSDWIYSLLLTDNSWIKKNKLTVKKYTLKDYMEEFYPDKRFVVNRFNQSNIVMIIQKN